MSLPFGMIFSIMLIILFIIIAFIAIKYFLGIQKCTKVGSFYKDLQEKVDSAFKSSGYKRTMNIDLPSGVTKICFANLSKAQIGSFKAEYEEIRRYDFYNSNTFLLPSGESCDMPHEYIEFLDLGKMTALKNPYCFPTTKDILVEFNIYDKGVSLKEA